MDALLQDRILYYSRKHGCPPTKEAVLAVIAERTAKKHQEIESLLKDAERLDDRTASLVARIQSAQLLYTLTNAEMATGLKTSISFLRKVKAREKNANGKTWSLWSQRLTLLEKLSPSNRSEINYWVLGG